MNILILIISITAIISFVAPNGSSNFEKYKFSVGAILNRKEYVRLISSGFLHADIMHLVFNMLTLYFFGPVVIQGFGNLGFLLFTSVLFSWEICFRFLFIKENRGIRQ